MLKKALIEWLNHLNGPLNRVRELSYELADPKFLYHFLKRLQECAKNKKMIPCTFSITFHPSFQYNLIEKLYFTTEALNWLTVSALSNLSPVS